MSEELLEEVRSIRKAIEYQNKLLELCVSSKTDPREMVEGILSKTLEPGAFDVLQKMMKAKDNNNDD